MNQLEKKLNDLTLFPTYLPDESELEAVSEVLETFEKGREVSNKGYNYFQGSSLYEAIDDWTKRWNGYVPPLNPLINQTQSNIFINFTRNAIISYLSKVAMSPVKAHIIAVNKKTGLIDQQFADVLEDLNMFSLNAENAPKKFLEAALECVTKGTVVVYEGYAKNEQKEKIPTHFDAMTGKLQYKTGIRTIFDNCFQRVVALEDFFILNPFQSDVQKQPKVIWREMTSYAEGMAEFSHYKNWKYVKPGAYTIANEIQTFYRDTLMTDLQKDQIEILRYYCRYENRHIVTINGVVMYDGPIPFKDGKYPFAKSINEPFANDFFWGNGSPNKYMGEQDLINTFINAMADKTVNSLIPTGLSSDLDDLIEDDALQIGKFRKVGDVEKWKWWEAPPVNGGEINMFQNILSLARESANSDAGSLVTPRGGKVQTRQVLLKQQEVMQKLSFNMNFLEDLERDRTELRVNHILQFYSIPKIEKITGKGGKEIEQLLYREVQLNDVRLKDGRNGNRVIKIIGDEHKNPDERTKIADELAVREEMGELSGVPTEALAISVDTFGDYNNTVQIIKNSSFEKNQALDQASRMEFAQWRLGLMELVPANAKAIVEWVEESFDIDTQRFEETPEQPGQMPQEGQDPNAQPAPGSDSPPPQGGGAPKPLQKMAAQAAGEEMSDMI